MGSFSAHVLRVYTLFPSTQPPVPPSVGGRAALDGPESERAFQNGLFVPLKSPKGKSHQITIDSIYWKM